MVFQWLNQKFENKGQEEHYQFSRTKFCLKEAAHTCSFSPLLILLHLVIKFKSSPSSVLEPSNLLYIGFSILLLQALRFSCLHFASELHQKSKNSKAREKMKKTVKLSELVLVLIYFLLNSLHLIIWGMLKMEPSQIDHQNLQNNISPKPKDAMNNYNIQNDSYENTNSHFYCEEQVLGVVCYFSLCLQSLWAMCSYFRKAHVCAPAFLLCTFLLVIRSYLGKRDLSFAFVMLFVDLLVCVAFFRIENYIREDFLQKEKWWVERNRILQFEEMIPLPVVYFHHVKGAAYKNLAMAKLLKKFEVNDFETFAKMGVLSSQPKIDLLTSIRKHIKEFRDEKSTQITEDYTFAMKTKLKLHKLRSIKKYHESKKKQEFEVSFCKIEKKREAIQWTGEENDSSAKED